MKESWKPVVGAERFYEVSDLGRVKSLHRIGRPAKGGILAQTPNKKGYLRVRLTINRKGISRVVHRLVLEAFIGPQPSSIHECNHKDGDKKNNRAGNLEWLTPVENNAHSVANGFWKPHKGEAHGRAKLTEADVREIRALRNTRGAGAAALGRRYGVTGETIRGVWTRRLWNHVL